MSKWKSIQASLRRPSWRHPQYLALITTEVSRLLAETVHQVQLITKGGEGEGGGDGGDCEGEDCDEGEGGWNGYEDAENVREVGSDIRRGGRGG